MGNANLCHIKIPSMKNGFLALCMAMPIYSYTQNACRLKDCEQAFRQNNLRLISQYYNISAADADVVQAKIWELPQLAFESNVYNPEQSRVADVAHYKSVSMQQLLALGGKRKREIAWAKSNRDIALLEYESMAASLLAELRCSFYSLYLDQQSLQRISGQLSYFNELLEAYQIQASKGNISLKDEVRIRSLVMSLDHERVQIANEILQSQNKLKLLTDMDHDVLPDIREEELEERVHLEPLMNLDDLIALALRNNAEYQQALKAVEAGQKYEDWQKSLNIPDVTGGLQWNQDGGAFRNEVNFSVSIPIPLWKQNKGNIQKARILAEQSQHTAHLAKKQLIADLSTVYDSWKNQYEQYNRISRKDFQNLENVYKGMLENFRRGNISLLEFTDFIDTYRQNISQFNEMKKQIISSSEELNRLVQSDLFKTKQ